MAGGRVEGLGGRDAFVGLLEVVDLDSQPGGELGQAGLSREAQAVLVLNNSKYAGASSLGALKDAKIGVQVATTSYQAVLDEIKPGQQPSVFNTTNDEVTALQNGQIDAVVTARVLLCVAQGMRVLGKTGRSREEMTSLVDSALKLLD